MQGVAQTSPSLLEQLRRLGHPEADVQAVRDAYVLAMRLFTGHFRPTGNTFLAHLVRTASILAEIGAPLPAITAGLLHAAYTHGEFGDGRRGPSPARRDEVRAAIGAASEALVWRFTALPWRPLLQALPGSLAALSPTDRAVLLIRLANELEEALDIPGAGCFRAEDGGVCAHLTRCGQAARVLEQPALAAALEAIRDTVEHAPAAAPPAYMALNGRDRVVWYGGPNGSFLLPPRSYRPRCGMAVRYWVRRSRILRRVYGMLTRAWQGAGPAG